MIGLLFVAGILVWLATGFYKVEPNEQGVELVFGKLAQTTGPGLNYNFPAPIGEVLKPKVTNVNKIEIGYREQAAGMTAVQRRGMPQESLMLTGDENILDYQYAVFWVISDAGKYLFNVRDPETAVRNASEAAMREIIGKTDFEFARTTGRDQVAIQAKELIQQIMDMYDSGITIQNVKPQNVDPPDAVIDAFRDVQAARADKERTINEATAYLNEVTQRAQGQAEQVVRAAEAYKQEKIAQAEGDASRFNAILTEYEQSREITKRRIYLDTMENVLSGLNKVILDDKSGSGVLPYLPLDQLKKAPPASGAKTKSNGAE